MIIVPILITSLIHFGWMYSFHLGVKGLNTTLWDTSPRENCWWGNTSCRETPLWGESSIRETPGFGRRRLTRRPLREEEAFKGRSHTEENSHWRHTFSAHTLSLLSHTPPPPHPYKNNCSSSPCQGTWRMILTLRDNGRVPEEFHCVTCPGGFPLYILSR